MQATPILSLSPSFGRCETPNESVEIAAKISEDFRRKLKLEDSNGGFVDSEQIAAKEKENQERNEEEEEDQEDVEAEEEGEEEFSFVCTNPDGSPICADEVFQNGEIRPVFPIFNRDLLFTDAYDGDSSTCKEAESLWSPLKKLFIEEQYDNPSSSASESDELERIPEGTYCEWSRKTAGSCKKSNSTGFSRLWRFRDLVHRSNSDGKDAFVFLNPNSARAKPSNESLKKMEMAEKEKKRISGPATAKTKAAKTQTASSVHEKHYIRFRAKKEGDKRRSYLPYRQDLVGFFTNVNGMSRNVHPF